MGKVSNNQLDHLFGGGFSFVFMSVIRSQPETQEAPMRQPSSTLSSLMKFIAGKYKFNGDEYSDSDFDNLTYYQQRVFMVNHSVLHMNKSLGRIAGEVEGADHGVVMDNELLREATVKMIINSLRLAEAVGLTPEDVRRLVPHYMKSK
jgi:hypothetical protein